MSAQCVNRAQMLDALEVVTAACERDRLYDEWRNRPTGAHLVYRRYCDEAERAKRLMDAYRARWAA